MCHLFAFFFILEISGGSFFQGGFKTKKFPLLIDPISKPLYCLDSVTIGHWVELLAVIERTCMVDQYSDFKGICTNDFLKDLAKYTWIILLSNIPILSS